MNSTLRTFITIFLTAIVVGPATYVYVSRDLETSFEVKEESSDTQPEENILEEAVVIPSNIVEYSYPETGVAIQFELPEGYGAVKDQVGEGNLQVTYHVGKLDTESSATVLQAPISMGMTTSVTIVPSNNPEVVTLEDWREKAGVYDGSGAFETETIELAGVTATLFSIGGLSTEYLIQFVKDKNYYAIHTEGSMETEDIVKIIETFSFTN